MVTCWTVVLAAVLASSASARGEGTEADESASLQPILAGEVPISVADLKAMQNHLRRLAERVIPCTVAVQVGPAQGSGVIISGDGFVLTAAHVAGKPGRAAMVILPDGRRVRAKMLGIYRTMDAGLAKIDQPPAGNGDSQWPHAEMATSPKLAPGQWCLATGHPGGFQGDRNPVVRVGRILSVQEDSAITTDCTLLGGDSGGPLFDMDGNVIGIHSRIGMPLAVNLHVPVSTYRESWDRLVSGEAWGYVPGNEPYIGVQGEPDSGAAKITRVLAGTPSEQAGIQPGDVIVKFAGKKVTDFGSLQALVAEEEPGNAVKLVVMRGEAEVELQLIVGRQRDQ